MKRRNFIGGALAILAVPLKAIRGASNDPVAPAESTQKPKTDDALRGDAMGHRLALDKAVYDYEVFKGSGVDAGADLCRAMRRLGDEMACSCREDTTRLLTDEESDRGRDPFAWEVDYDDRWNAVSEDKRQKALSYLKSRDAKNRKNNG